MNSLFYRKITIIAFILLFSVFFTAMLSVKLWDYDFWWHIATGRYIVENKKLPDSDPFSFTSQMKENNNLFPERENFILKQYWLGQVIFYLIYNYTGPAGIIILRSLILTTVLLLIVLRFKQWHVSFYVSFIYIFFAYLDILSFLGERPVLFTILFTPLIFIILERFKDNVSIQKKKSWLVLFFLLPLMFFWANLHGGFILGNSIIMVYMLCEGIKIIFKKAAYTNRETVLFYTATGSALVFSCINPTGWDAFFIALSPEYSFTYIGIQEYESPIFLFLNKLAHVKYGYVILAIAFPLILVLRNKKMDFTHVVLLICLFIMALKAYRYTVYYSIIAAMILGKETDRLFKSLFERVPSKVIYVFYIVMLLSSVLFFANLFNLKAVKLDIAKGSHVPVKAVDFIEKNRLAGNMLNSHRYGGYSAWRLYPWKKTFIDTRWLNYTVQSEYGWIMNTVETIYNRKLPAGKTPLWKRLLAHYNINFIMLNTLDVYGNVPNLLFSLAKDDEWIPIYADPAVVIFIRNVSENNDLISKFKLSEADVYNSVIAIAAHMATYNKNNPKYLVTIGRTFEEMDKSGDALTAFKYASKRFPKEPGLQEKIIELEAKIEDAKSNKTKQQDQIEQ